MGDKEVTAKVGIVGDTDVDCCGDIERCCLAFEQLTWDLFRMNARSLLKLLSFFDGLIFL